MDGTHFAKYLAHSQMTVLEEVVDGWMEKYMYLFLGCNLLLCLPFCCDMFLEVSRTERPLGNSYLSGCSFGCPNSGIYKNLKAGDLAHNFSCRLCVDVFDHCPLYFSSNSQSWVFSILHLL